MRLIAAAQSAGISREAEPVAEKKHEKTAKKHHGWWWALGILAILAALWWWWANKSAGSSASASTTSYQPASSNLFVAQPGLAAQNEATLVGQALTSRSNSQKHRSSPSRATHTGSEIVATPHIVTGKAAVSIPSSTAAHTSTQTGSSQSVVTAQYQNVSTNAALAHNIALFDSPGFNAHNYNWMHGEFVSKGSDGTGSTAAWRSAITPA